MPAILFQNNEVAAMLSQTIPVGVKVQFSVFPVSVSVFIVALCLQRKIKPLNERRFTII